MPIFRLDTFGTSSIGVYLRVTEEFIIAPPQVPKSKLKILEAQFNMEVYKTNIGGSVLVGSLVFANSKGMILPRYIKDEEVNILRSLAQKKDLNIIIAKTKKTAYGNLILANDRGAIVDPSLSENDVKLISETLDVEAVRGKVAGLPYVGSLAIATNKGILAHPLIKAEEEKLLTDVLKVPVGIGTVNFGIPYIATGLIGNTKVAVAGSLTTGPEIFMIGHALDVMD